MKWSPSKRSRVGMGTVFGILILLGILLLGQLANLQLIQGSTYRKLASAKHFSLIPSYPERGKIVDANGETLALTTYVYTIGITPAAVSSRPQDSTQRLSRDEIEKGLAAHLKLDLGTVQEAMAKKDAPYVILKKEIPKEEYDPLDAFLDQHGIRGVAVDSLPKRFYPKGNIAPQLVGFSTRRDNYLVGVNGLEAYYDQSLAGKPGYTYGEVDHYYRGQLPFSNPTEEAPVPGSNLILNLNSTLQQEVQKIVERYNDLFGAADGAAAMVLDTHTGAVLAMAQEHSYDLNAPYETPRNLEGGAREYLHRLNTIRGRDPKEVAEKTLEKYEKRKDELIEQVEKLTPGIRVQGPPTPVEYLRYLKAQDTLAQLEVSLPPAGQQRPANYRYQGWDPFNDRDDLDYLNSRVWNNRNISFTYEPGSTLKAFTVASAFEEHAFDLNEQFSDAPIWIRGFGNYAIHCHVFPKNHGYETVEQALGNSCNPVMVQLAERVGIEKFYEYMHALNFYDKTEIDLPAESKGLLHENPNIVDLAPMSFGESNTITPIMLASAYTVFGNGGVMMKPQVVKYLTDRDEKIIREFPPTPIRQVYSKETAQTVLAMLRSAFVTGIVNYANEPGYFAGGKSGTSTQALLGGEDQDYAVMSVASVFPVDEPRFVVLAILYDPDSLYTTGVQSMTRDLIRATGRVFHVPKRYTDQDLAQALAPKEIAYANGITLQSIADYLATNNVEYELSPDMKPTDFFYTMYPLGKQKLNGYPVYYVSKNGDPPKEQVEVPDFTGKTFEEAAELAYQKRINLRYVGNPLAGVVVEQSVAAQDESGRPQKMQKYEVVELTFGPLPGYNPPVIHRVVDPRPEAVTQLPIRTDPIFTTQYIYSPYGAIPEQNPYGG